MVTPLEDLKFLSTEYEIDLKVKRDDLYAFTGGGNKARKMKFILNDAEKKEADAFVTAGAINSNHARVVAITGAQKKWPVHIIIHDKQNAVSGNLQLMKLTGARITFVEKHEVADAMDAAMDELKDEGYHPYYIMGGGHSVEGMRAYYEAVKEFFHQANGWKPDYVIHASGTGGTQAGLHVGFKEYFPETKVFGISVAREKERGHRKIKEGISKLCSYLEKEDRPGEIYFFDDWIGDGYESIYPALEHSIGKAARKDGLITDPTYSGKAMTALFEMFESGSIIKGSRVLFWHTGGLINLFQYSEIV